MKSHYHQTLAASTTFGHYSHQGEGDRKLMGHLLVHSQRFGSLVEISNWTLVKDEQEGSQLSSSILCLCQNFWIGLVHVGYTLWLGWVMLMPLFSLGLVLLLSHIWTYKMDINDTHYHEFSSLMDSYCQWILNIIWVLTDTCNGSLGNDL